MKPSVLHFETQLTVQNETMVKRQKEKQYQSATEQKANAQLRVGRSSNNNYDEQRQRKLPFGCCALTFLPIQDDPVCIRHETKNGILFDATALIPFVRKYHIDPITGDPLTTLDIISLQMEKNDEGRWHCPILHKVMTDSMKIIAIQTQPTTAHVYSWEAYQELNIKPKNYQDLMTGESFHPKNDVILLNDPDAATTPRDYSTTLHQSQQARLFNSDTKPTIQHSITATRVMNQLQTQLQQKQQLQTTDNVRATTTTTTTSSSTTTTPQYSAEAVTGYKATSGLASSSLTSTSSILTNTNESRQATQEEILQAQFNLMKHRKSKGFCTLRTTLGDIGIELHCDITPRMCTNFLGLADNGKYNGTQFHRLIPTFMIQGGKSHDDTDEQSLWGHSFPDEFDDRLTHSAEGIVSMANSGPGTNQRQFFITLAAAPHLDKKHSVFGRVIEGMHVLREMKNVPVDKNDRPIHPIMIETIQVLVNPAKEAEDLEKVRIETRMKELQHRDSLHSIKALGGITKQQNKLANTPTPSIVNTKPEVGKYLKIVNNTNNNNKVNYDEVEFVPVSRLKPPPKKTKFGDFSGW